MLDVNGDWAAQRPDVRPGGWAFQYANPHYPDLDDTAVVVMAMDRADRGAHRRAGRHAERRSPGLANGSTGLQSRNGGWGAFDADNNTNISTTFPSPITARCSIRRRPT